MKELLRPYDPFGVELDASFGVEAIEGGIAVLFASRGGTKGTSAARNIQYHIGLTVVLGRLKELGATLTDILLDSAAARKHPPEQRRLHFPVGMPLPVSLSEVTDVDAFRRVVSEAQRNVLTEPGRNAKHGNRVRSIRILCSLPAAYSSLTLEQIGSLLRGDQASLPTPAAEELESRVVRLRARGRVSRPTGNLTPPRIEDSSAYRYVRLPSVVVYVLQRADGRCELCGSTTFFTAAGDPYLEVHHLVQLAHGGPDTPENAAALCPNCHRELHYGAAKSQRMAMLYERVPELQHPHPLTPPVSTQT